MELRFDLKKLTELMLDFYTLTNIRMVMFDNSFQKICSFPEGECGFCEEMKKNVRSQKLCKACDEEACRRCKEENRLHIYECHAGLTEAAFPLKFGDINLGYIMFGQIVNKDTKTQRRDELLSYAGGYISSAPELFDRLTSKRGEQIRAAAKLMETCACYLWVTEMVRVDDGGMAFRLSNYIAENLASDLTVDRLCEHFCVSRNRLYRMSHEYFGMTIAAYIRIKRVDEASRMLSGGATVAEAASTVGIDDYNYFSKIFKRETGTLPSKVKKRS